MRNQPYARAYLRVALFAAVACTSACNQAPPDAPRGQLADFASGVDAEFGVETFALSTPTLQITSPIQNYAYESDFTTPAAVKVDVCLYPSNFKVGTNPTDGKIICRLDGATPLTTATLVPANDPSGCLVGTNKITFPAVPQKVGMHSLECNLADASGQELTDVTAHAVRQFYVTQNALVPDPLNGCANTTACDDKNVCSQENCALQCVFSYIIGCCNNKFDCDPGDTCNNNKCTSCLADPDCADGDDCTVDKCDLSGIKGVCKNTKPNPESCCKITDLCDDGLACTVDSCDMAQGLCVHDKMPGVCCAASDCPATDPCTIPACVDLECRYGADTSRPDCCSPTTNPLCGDKNTCTIDSCVIAKVDANGKSWTQCQHVQDPKKPKCCDLFNSTKECDDGNACTVDVCQGNVCQNNVNALCCKADIDCDDNNTCTVDSCPVPNGSTTGNCLHAKTAGCCHQPADCDDGLYCTTESCNLATETCQSKKLDPTCCDSAAECDDGNTCNVDACINHYCVHGPDANQPGCCNSNTECNDGKPCTVDTCDTVNKKCTAASNGIAGCCNSQLDCDDGICTTLDYCNASNLCEHKPFPDQCKIQLDCDDGDPCTIDACDLSGGCGKCTHTQDPKCCSQDFQCDDSKPLGTNPPNPKAVCTADKCVKGICQSNFIAGCCLDDKDALTACDDANGCTLDYCYNNQCRHTAPKNGCCAATADCNDGNKCTTDACSTISPTTGIGACTHALQPGCVCTPAGASNGTECNDGNDCTADGCSGGLCTHSAIAGCCIDKFDCNDGNSCTADYCIQASCLHYTSVAGNNLCCNKTTEAVDCAYLNSDCATGVCQDQPDNSRKCVAQQVPICTVNLNYCQDFAAGTSLQAMGWNPGDVKGTAAKNWGLAKDGGLGPDQHAAFNWTPTVINYETCLQSPIIQAAGAKAITMQFDREFTWNQGNTVVSVYGSLNGAAVDWTTATQIDTVVLSADQAAQTVSMVLPAELSGSNGLRIGMCLQGATTFNLTSFALDNICVVKGYKPVMSKCPVNQIVPLGTKKTLPIKAIDPDTDAVLSFSLVQAPTFVTLTSAIYYWLDTSWNTTLTINPADTAAVGTWPVTIKVSDGSLYSTCTFNITVTYKGGYLIWTPSEVPKTVGDTLFQALKKQGKVVQNISDLSLYPDLTGFSGVLVTLGIYPDNHVLTEIEAKQIALYLAQSGHVYMEGGDTWAFDPATSLHGLFNVLPLGDSTVNGITGPLNGLATPFVDIFQTPVKTYNFGYDQGPAWNNLNDVITGKTAIHRTKNILANTLTTGDRVQVAHQDDTGYRTIGSSVLFGGVLAAGTVANTDGPDEMMKQILFFFDNGFQECKAIADCDDKDDCTKDSCTAGECGHQSICSCSAVVSLSCTGNNYKLVSNGTGSTNSIAAYGCDTVQQYTGKEMAVQFTAASSGPVTLSATNVTNPAARLFVLKANANGCDGAACIAMGDGVKSITFPAALGASYFIVLDVPNGGTAQADIAFQCGQGENCADGLDNNANGLIDCKDLASCCGDPSCGEICDGLDNNCDGKVDEGCNNDGDAYCNKTMTIVGTPPVCPQGGGDCDDVQATVNPGVPEICANGKDDNCNGVQDEEGAVGCKSFWVDLDSDGYGGGSPKCLCAASGQYKALKGGDCNDGNAKVNPGATEICGNAIDDDCSGTQNDLNAQGCSDFYTDADGDAWGALPKKCLCVGEGLTTATKPGDCNDADKNVNPDFVEVCNNQDDNCNNVIDEGCDDDKDGYCDITLGYVTIGGTIKKCTQGLLGQSLTLSCDAGMTITNVDFASWGTPTGTCGIYQAGTCDAPATAAAVKNLCLGKPSCVIDVQNATFGGDPCSGTTKLLDVQVLCTGNGGVPPDICPKGAGDTNDNDPNINPAGKEICDGKDNDSNGKTDEGCDDDGDGFCDSTMVVIGVPAICPKTKAISGLGDDCDDTKAKINTAAAEDCATVGIDDNCNGLTNEVDAANCTVFFVDGDKDGYGTKQFKCMCAPVGQYSAKKTADCIDTDPSINPGMAESCDNIDNNCDGKTDEGCDADGDGYCNAALKLPMGAVPVCPNGGNDCDDTNANVNPSQVEICGNGIDDNCNNSQNDPGALGCSVFYADADSDTFGSTSSKCLCTAAGTFQATNSNDCNDLDGKINPLATEICDDKDNDCNGKVDEGCDDDKDGYCDTAMKIVGTPMACPKGGSDCNDLKAAIHPAAIESCDDIDQNCDGVTDEGCDKDQDGYCDASLVVATPLPQVCLKGNADCNDLNNAVNPGAPEICGNGIDDNCNGSQNDIGAINCTKFFFDGDGDAYGLNVTQCMCQSAGAYTATQGNDCDDTNINVNPGAKEVCGDGIDNNCNLDQNDVNATGCKVFYFDQDQDGYGLTALNQCLCVGANTYTALLSGDCNDTAVAVNPSKPELCDNIDNNCDGKVDEGCDKDGDKYCTTTMTTVGLPNTCPFGGGDCDDNNANANPGFAEQCDAIDNNCNGSTDEGCNADGDKYCTAAMKTIGTPITCVNGGGDCNDADSLVNPGVNENCATTWDDNCNGSTNDVNATGCIAYGMDADGDTYNDKTLATSCTCKPAGLNTGTKPNDCDDKNNLVNPGMPELCDGVDNNCNGAIDEGCDVDNDDYCNAAMITIGKPPTCTKGGNDCNDADVTINPGVNENCSTVADDNCNGLTNEANATGCSNFYLDGDNDGYAANVYQCLCVASGSYKLPVTKLGDCDDTKASVNPSVTEVCGDGVDNNCDGSQNDLNATGCTSFYVDGDLDGYGTGAAKCQCFAQGAYIATLITDCNDANNLVYPGKPESCDNVDNNCSGAADEGCDDDLDLYCDLAMVVVGTPTVCSKGGGDCADTNATVNPGAVEKCDNIDQNCDGTTDNGCDDDKDGYCDKSIVMVGTPAICLNGGNDCDDGNSLINPGKTELCDNLDNNCNSVTDELCDKDLDKYCDINMTVIGTPTICTSGGGDCNDGNAAINPGAIEICDNIDNNCAGGTDEVCKDTDGDGYCVGSVAVSAGCPKGGMDCDDTNKLINPGATETCATQFDDDCNPANNNAPGTAACTNFWTDVDVDGFGVGSPTCQCLQVGTLSALVGGDCLDSNAAVNPNAAEMCDGLDNNCSGVTDEGCDDDVDGYCDSAMLMTSTAKCANSAKPAVGAKITGDDCNDTSAAVHPGLAEKCDGLDNNCDTQIDEGCDDDHDLYCDSAMTVVGTPAVCPNGAGDCNDLDKSVNPGAQENCTTPYDDNCKNGTNELNAIGCTNFYTDSDLDGYGVLPAQCLCVGISPFTASKAGDCNDTSALVYPNSAAETCDGVDNDCNGQIDEGCDADGDGYCTSALVVTKNNACPKTAATGAKGDDCNDTDKLVNPGMAELCDNVDNNCDAGHLIDEGCDKDGDKYCDSTKQVVGTPAICINGGGDCNDADIAVNPATAEVCNGKDDNCNKIVDEANATGCTTWYFDGDQDGVGVNSSQCLCAATGLFSSKANNDCNDTSASCYPALAPKGAAPELCDGLDNNCNGAVDEGCNADGDGYCTAAMTTVGTPPICNKGGGDCNDGNASINPGAVELCNNVDENCNGIIDEGAGSVCAFPNANAVCQAGQCVIASCHASFYNLNASTSDGCECNGSDVYEPNNSCGAAYVLDANLSDQGQGGGTKDVIAARLVDATDEDWYAIYGADGADSGSSSCDQYNVRVQFTANPGGLAFDVTRGGCPNGSNTVCCGQTDFNWFTNFKGASGGESSRQYSEYGECPCTSDGNQFDQWNTGWQYGPGNGGPYCMDYNSGYVCFPRGYYFTKCQDDSAWYYVRVYKVSGGPVCANYKLEFTNGIYGNPGTGNGKNF